MGRHSQLLKRIVLPFFILLAVITLTSMAIVYTAFVSKAHSDADTAARRIAAVSADQVGTYLEELGMIADQVNHQPRITGVFYELKYDEDPGNNFDSDILSSIDVSSALFGLTVERAADYNILVYNGNGDFISSQAYLLDKPAVEAMLDQTDYESELEKLEKNGGVVVLSPESVGWIHNDTVYVTVRKPLQNDYASKASGIIEVRGSVGRLVFDSGDSELEDVGIILRERGTGRVIVPSEFVESDPPKEYVTVPVNGTDLEVAVSFADPVTASFILRIILLFILIFILLSGFILFVTYFIGRNVTRPIMQLAHRVKKINAPDEQLERVGDETLDEIRELEDSFDKMLERVNNSLLQEKKAYSLALQAQMNPHFLYNTLSVIGSAGAEAGADNVTDMCVRLSDMLRYVASYEKITVPLKDEVTHTSNYLSLMKSRYEEHFNYSISVDEKLMNMPVPKLFIQPLAENCFKHGFKMSPPPWNIDIKMHGTPRHWELTIKDNGTGITEQRIAEICATIEKATSEMSLSDIGGVGLVNTIVRLKMTHSRKLQFKIWNSSGTGVIIIVDSES